MRYFSLVIFLFISLNAYAINYKLENKIDYNNDDDYYTLSTSDENAEKNIDISFMGKGNAHEAEIIDTLTFSCSWGKVEGVRVRSSSFNFDGGEAIDEFFFFDKQLNNIFARMYIRALHPNSKTVLVPVSLKTQVCEQKGEGAQKDSISGKYTIADYEVITHGPFLLKGVPNTYIKYLIGHETYFSMHLVRENEHGEDIIDSYKYKNNTGASITTLFFLPLAGQNNLINLVYWGSDDKEWQAEGNKSCYQVYGYHYDKQGNLSANPLINNDPNLSGCDNGNNKFKYNNAAAIKTYLKQKYENTY